MRSPGTPGERILPRTSSAQPVERQVDGTTQQPATQVPASQPVVSLADVSMAFGTNRVLSGVSMAVSEGSVLALIGANGAGKSTLIKILSGVYPEHGGEIRVDGRPVRIDSPSGARSLGIHTVHQRIAGGVIPGVSVRENLS